MFEDGDVDEREIESGLNMIVFILVSSVRCRHAGESSGTSHV